MTEQEQGNVHNFSEAGFTMTIRARVHTHILYFRPGENSAMHGCHFDPVAFHYLAGELHLNSF